MDVKLALLADYANITREGKLNVMGLFTIINAPIIPWTHPQMQLVLELEADPAEWDTQKNIDIKLMDADANQLLSIQGGIKVPRGQSGQPSRINSIMTFVNIKFNSVGDYAFVILIGGETKTRVPLRINHVPLPHPPNLPPSLAPGQS